MRAWVVNRQGPVEDGPLELVDIAVPEPGPSEVLVKIRACGVCRTDLHVIEGDLDARRDRVCPGHQIVGEVVAVGDDVTSPATGTRVGIAWLRRTCGTCRFCTSDRENLCERAEFNGWTHDGGFAEFAVAPAAFTYPLPDGFSDLAAAPLLCAGIIGYRSLALTSVTGSTEDLRGMRLGLYGFGAAGHVVIQLARARGAEVYVCTRDRERHQALATDLGATWVGDATDAPPARLDASIVFAPAGELVPVALEALDDGGRLVLAGIHMSPIPRLPYRLLYRERVVRSVANNTRADGRAFLAEAARIPIETHVVQYSITDADRALRDLKHDAIRGAAVLVT